MLASLRALIVRWLEMLAIGVFSALVLDVLWGVASRYVLGDQARWSEELARLLLGWLTMLGAALAYLQHRHLGVDVLVRQLHPDAQRVTQVVAHLAVFIFSALVLCHGGAQLVLQRWEFGQLLPALAISKAWFYLALPISGAIICLFSVEAMISAARGRFIVSPASTEEEEQ